MDVIDWNQLKAFLATAETGSLSAAARKLGLTQPTLSRQVAAIERRLEVTLFERAGKAMVLTTTGMDLLEHARAMGAAAQELELAATGRSQAVEGMVSVSASGAVAAYLLPKALHRIREEAPGITVEVIASDAFSDLRLREADIAVRHIRPEQPDLIGRLVREATASFYASRDWIREHGHPRTAEEAAECSFIGADRAGRHLAFLNQFGLALTPANFTNYADDTIVSWELARKGLGIGTMMDDIAREAPEMVRILETLPPIRFPIWLVTHRELHTARRIRIVFDKLVQALA